MQFSVICLLGLVACASAQIFVNFTLGKRLTFSLLPFLISKNASVEVSAGNRVRRQILPNRFENHQARAGFEFSIDDPLNRSFSPNSQPNVPGPEKPIPSEPKLAGLGSNRPRLGVPRSSIRENTFWLSNRALQELILRNKELSTLLPQNTKTKSTTDLESTSTQTSSQATTASTNDSTDEPANEPADEPADEPANESADESTTEPTTDASTTESNDASTTEPTTEAESTST